MTQNEFNNIDHAATDDKRILDMASKCWMQTKIPSNADSCVTCGNSYCKYQSAMWIWRDNEHIKLITVALRALNQ